MAEVRMNQQSYPELPTNQFPCPWGLDQYCLKAVFLLDQFGKPLNDHPVRFQPSPNNEWLTDQIPEDIRRQFLETTENCVEIIHDVYEAGTVWYEKLLAFDFASLVIGTLNYLRNKAQLCWNSAVRPATCQVAVLLGLESKAKRKARQRWLN